MNYILNAEAENEDTYPAYLKIKENARINHITHKKYQQLLLLLLLKKIGNARPGEGD